MTRGFLLGKFMPPHRGHLMLCDFARNYCDELTILVCTRASEPIDGVSRANWMRELCCGTRVVHFDRDVPQEPSEHIDFWNIWREIVKCSHPEPIDFVFTSESYGCRLAREVGARHIPFDPHRLAASISGSQIRRNPYAAWAFLPPPVRAHYVKTVCLFGPESTGKSTLSRMLAERFSTIAAPEYGRTYCEQFGTDCSANDLRNIVRGQSALEFAARRQANRILVLDTDAVMTAVWADMLLGERPADLETVERVADFYLLADIDVPWADDGTRYFPDQARRQKFFDLCSSELSRRRVPFAVIRGNQSERLHAGYNAVVAHFPEVFAE